MESVGLFELQNTAWGISLHLIWDVFQALEHLCREAALLVSFSGNFPVPHGHSPSVSNVNIYSLLQYFTARYLGF